MKNVQEVFSELKECAKEQKEIRQEYKDALLQESEYEEIKEKIEKLKERKKELENIVQGQMGNRWNKLDDLKRKTAELKQMQSDVAMSSLMDGKTVEVKDEFDNIYEPRFNVTFKKTSAKYISSENN
jgi:predicted nuclease with TOPRIM domain